MYQVEDKSKRELYTYKVLNGIIVRYEYRLAYSWEEGAAELEAEGYEVID